ncbi:MAG TPA: HPP family protein [Kofleriaceae bacterium]|nr:HPP family protein [Kofleriaceae bacterium]
MGEAENAGVPEAWPKRHGESAGALWSALAASLLVAIAIALAVTARSAFLFVSAGPIIYEFVERPLARASSPRSTILANGLALLVAYSALAVFGLRGEPSTLQEGVTLARAGAVVCAIAVLGGLLVLVGAVHPPAGSTLLLVTLGIMHQPLQLVCVFVGVVVLTACAWAVNRLAGLDVPIWTSPKPSPYQEVASDA